MGLEMERYWALLLIPAGILAVWLIDRRYSLRKATLKRRVTRGMRILLLTVLALAIVGPSVLLASGETARWVLLDASDSAKSQRAAAESRVAQQLASLPKGETAGVIAFGANAMVETPLGSSPNFTGLHTQISGEKSDLDYALRLAAALTPSGAGGITVVADSRAKVSQATAEMLRSQGVKVDALVLSSAQGADAQVSELIAPAELRQGQSIPLTAVLDANEDMTGTLVLYQNGEATATREVTLKKGENRFAFSDTAAKTGVVTYEARFLSDSDTQPKNNSAAAYVRVLGAASIALVTENEATAGLFEAAGIAVETLSPAEMPLAAEGYLSCDAIVLNNIDYDAASEKQWRALDSAVRTLGRGLCVLGGDSSYALGGYRGTLVEDLLPVTIDVREKLRMPALSLVICIDKSGSMTAGQFGSTRIEVAKEAAMSATEVLNEQDFIGVIGFDEAAKWVVPFQNVTDVAAIQEQIGTMRADGGTAFYSALDEAYRTLSQAKTPQKHVIFLSDGQPADNGFQDIVKAMKHSGITVTTVAVGADADQLLMRQIADLGGGRNYNVGEFDNIPKIFTKETMLVGGSYVQNRTFTPVITETGSLTNFAGFPALDGYLTCAEKSTATVSLISDTEDPILAWWNAGAGKVLAWTSDAQGAWTGSFLQWDEAPSFFGGMVAKVSPGESREGTLEADVNGDTLRIVYTVENDGETPARTEATVLAPDGTETSVVLTETAAGRYEAQLGAALEGAYALRVAQTAADGTTLHAQEGGAVRGFSSEYDLRDEPDDSLANLCAQTGGRVLSESDGFWDTPVHPAETRRQLQGALCAAALCLLLADIALRKLPWEDAVAKLLKRETQRETPQPARRARPETKPKPKPGKQETMEQSARQTASALLDAKKARERK